MPTGSRGRKKSSKSSSGYTASLKSDWETQNPVSKNIKKERKKKKSTKKEEKLLMGKCFIFILCALVLYLYVCQCDDVIYRSYRQL